MSNEPPILPVGPEEITPAAALATLFPEVGEIAEGQVTVEGVLVFRNRMGKTSIFKLQDASGQVQIQLRAWDLGPARYELFKGQELGVRLRARGPVLNNSHLGLLVVAHDIHLVEAKPEA